MEDDELPDEKWVLLPPYVPRGITGHKEEKEDLFLRDTNKRNLQYNLLINLNLLTKMYEPNLN